MADVKTEQEPSIEEILESIRQIISEDGEEEKKADEAAPVPPPAPEPERVLAAQAPPPEPPAPADDVIDLTDRVGDDLSAGVQVELQDTVDQSMNLDAPADENSLLSDMATDASAAAMAKLLAGNMAVERDLPGRVGNVTLEDIARELMKPLLKTWLDQNMPRIVEKAVAREVEKISRLAMKQ